MSKNLDTVSNRRSYIAIAERKRARVCDLTVCVLHHNLGKTAKLWSRQASHTYKIK